jgi:hypothetical protein
MNEILDTINDVAKAIPWELVIASGVLSPAVLAVKKWLGIQNEKVMMALVLVSGLIGAAVTYILSVPTDDPSIIAVRGLMIAAMSQPVYYLLVKPVATWLSAELAKAAAFDAEVKSAAIPEGGLPVSGTQV